MKSAWGWDGSGGWRRTELGLVCGLLAKLIPAALSIPRSQTNLNCSSPKWYSRLSTVNSGQNRKQDVHVK